MRLKKRVLCLFALIVAFLFLINCGSDTYHRTDDPDDPNAAGLLSLADPETSPDDDSASPGLQVEKLEELFDEMGFEKYLDIRPVRQRPALNGYTRYFYSTDDMKCYDGSAMSVAVSEGDSNNVMFFMEGGGASWPGYYFSYAIDILFDISFKSRWPNNPLKDWNFVYVPYCDNSIHAGDSETIELDREVYHHGLRHTAAAAALMKELFPNPDKVLITGVSAGGFGTYMAWPIVKSLYMDTDTYVLSDSGVGFWNPEKPVTWETIQQGWNLRIPSACEKCNGPVQTWLYELYMEYDPQVRIGLFTAYRDFIISRMFLQMSGVDFESMLMDITDQIKAEYPDRFGRFFIDGYTHTTYEFILPEGPRYQVDGVSLFEWIDMMVNDYPQWNDRLE